MTAPLPCAWAGVFPAAKRARPPRLPLAGERRAQVTALVERAAKARPA